MKTSLKKIVTAYELNAIGFWTNLGCIVSKFELDSISFWIEFQGVRFWETSDGILEELALESGGIEMLF